MQSLVYSAPETVAAHRPFLYRYALSKLRQPETAEDLVQETLLAATAGKAVFRGESALRTWLAGIPKHKIADWFRREARNPICDQRLRWERARVLQKIRRMRFEEL